MKNFVVLTVFSFLLWLLLTGSLATAEIVTGAVVAVTVAMLAAGRIDIFSAVKLSPAAALAFLRYLPVFFIALIKANMDMARRVLSPSLPLRPALVKIDTALTSELGLLVLANSITLTPGTLSVDVDDGQILVHWIDAPADIDTQAATQIIAADFEKHIRGFLS